MNFLKKIFKTDSKTCTKENESCSADKSADAPEALLPTINFEPLKQEGNSYVTTRKVAYKKVRELKYETIERVFDFAYTMAFDEKHRKTRSGGKIKRKNGEIFANTFQGKLAECAAVNFFYKYDNTIQIDFDTYDLGIWDKVDLTVCKKEVAVKSTKHFGQLLLLRTFCFSKSLILRGFLYFLLLVCYLCRTAGYYSKAVKKKKGSIINVGVSK